MLKFKQIVLAIILSLSFTGISTADALTGRQIMDQVAERHEKDFEYEVQEMVLIDKKGNKEKRLLKRYQRKGEDENFKYLMVFHDPSGVRGVALLTWQNKEKDDDQFMYLPSMGKKMKRIAKGGKRNYFMGTDFTFEDLVTESRDKFTYKRLPDETKDGAEYFLSLIHI